MKKNEFNNELKKLREWLKRLAKLEPSPLSEIENPPATYRVEPIFSDTSFLDEKYKEMTAEIEQKDTNNDE